MTATMQFGVQLPPFAAFGDPRVLVDLAVAAEETGWDGFFLWDHIQYSEPVPLADPWISLAAVAGATSRVRVGPLVTPLARRRPWKVAREAVTLDHLSGGRVVLGVGLGIDFWREFSSFSGEVGDDRERAHLADDGIEIITRLWSGEPVSYEGARLSVQGAQFLPRPVQQPRIPLWSAAIWPPLGRGPIRRAARCDGVVPFGIKPLVPTDIEALCEAVARQRGTDEPFDVCVAASLDQADVFARVGATWLITPVAPDTPLRSVQQMIESGPPRP